MAQQATIQLRDFELQIVKAFQAQGQIFVAPKAEWIRGHVKAVAQDYGTGMYKRWCSFCELSGETRTRENKVPKAIKAGTYGSFMTYLWLLEKLQLLKLSAVVHVRRNVDAKKQRRYYELNAAKLNNSAWKHPFQAAYSSTSWANVSTQDKARYRGNRKASRAEKCLGRLPQKT